MAQPAANLRVRISADLNDIKSGLGLLRGELAKVKAEAAKSAPDSSAWSTGIGKIRTQLGNLLGAYVGVQTLTAGVHGLADALERADRIGELALQSGMSTESLSRLAYAAQFSGVTIESLNGAVVKLSKGMVASEKVINGVGVSTRDAAGNFRSTEEVILDLADVFASLPDSPERAALAVKLFGRSGAELIPLLVEGKQKLQEYGDQAAATGNVISGEAAASAGEFNDNLDRLKGALAGVANETIRNVVPAVSGYAEEAAKAGQTSNFAAQGGQFLARVLKVVAAGAIIVKNVVEGLVNVLAFCNTAVTTIAGTIVGTFARSLGVVARAGKGLLSGENPFLVFAKFTKDAGATVKANLEGLISGKNSIANGFKAMTSGVSEAASDIANVGKLFDDAAANATSATKGIDSAAQQATPASQALLETIRKLLGEGSGGDKGKKSGTSAKIEHIAASTALLQDSVKRAQEQLDQQLEDQQISIADYYAKRVELQQRLIDLQIEQAQSELEVTKGLDQRRRLEEQIIILQRDRGEVAVNAAREQKKAEEELNKTKLEGFRTQQSQISGTLSATEGSISAQMDAGTLGAIEGERRLKEIRQQSLDQLLALRARQFAWLAGMTKADPQYAAAQQGLLELDTSIANIQASMSQFSQGIADAGLGALNTFWNNLLDRTQSTLDTVKQLFSDFATNVFGTVAQDFSKNIVDTIRGWVSSFGSDLAGSTANAATETTAATAAAAATTAAAATAGATTTASAVAAAATTTAGATTAASILTAAGAAVGAALISSATTAAAIMRAASALSSFGAAHGGGTAGSLTMTRHNINPLVFGNAPRYHGGGIAGLRPGELPIIVEEGERIRTKEQEAALQEQLKRGGNASQGIVTTPIVAIGDDAIADALASAAGERAVVTIVRRNWGGLSRGT